MYETADPTERIRAPIQLLIVDDDPLSATLLYHLTSLLGYEATVENDPHHAIDLALSYDFDLLLLDLSMPALDGFGALARLRGREHDARRQPLPAVAVTGYASAEDRLRCLTAGFDEHLAKPVQAAELKAIIERVLGRSRATDAEARATDAERLRANAERLGAVRAGERAFVPTPAESFALQSARLIETLRSAVDARDAARTAHAAQALHDSAELLGASRLAAMAIALGQASGAERWHASEDHVASLEHEHQAVLTLLLQRARG